LGLTLAEVPTRVDGEVKEGLLKLVDDAVVAGWAHARACRTLGVSDVRVHRWRKRQSEIGSLEDLAPGGNPVHRLLGWEIDAILELIETWAPTDRTHRKLAHRGSYLGIVYVAPSTVLRVAESADVVFAGRAVASETAAAAVARDPLGTQPDLDLGCGAPRGALEPCGAERAPPPTCRSRLVKLRTARTRERAGGRQAVLTTPGRASTVRWFGFGKRDGKV
jgi:hypothetical protein